MNAKARILKFSLAGVLCLSLASCSGSATESQESFYLDQFSQACADAVGYTNSAWDSMTNNQSDWYKKLESVQGTQPGLLLAYGDAVRASENIESVDTAEALANISGAIISSMNLATKAMKPEYWQAGVLEDAAYSFSDTREILPKKCTEFDAAVADLGN